MSPVLLRRVLALRFDLEGARTGDINRVKAVGGKETDHESF